MKNVLNALLQFRDERDWQQFHTPKDLAAALSIEASELLEVFLWKTSEQADLERVKEELADVFAYALLMADVYGLDVEDIVLKKIEKNKLKYPIEKSKGSSKKHSEYI